MTSQRFGGAVAALQPMVSVFKRKSRQTGHEGQSRRHYEYGNMTGMTALGHSGSGVAAAVAVSK